MLAVAALSTLVLALGPSPTLSSAAGVPTSCVDDGAWVTSFPDSVRAAVGLYDTVNRVIYLRHSVCERLQLLVAGARPGNIHYQYDFSEAVFLFAHEIEHARGIDDESQADCAAGRNFLRTAATLGVGPGYSRVLADYLVNARIPQRCYPNSG